MNGIDATESDLDFFVRVVGDDDGDLSSYWLRERAVTLWLASVLKTCVLVGTQHGEEWWGRRIT